MRIFKRKILLAVLVAVAMMATFPVLQSCSNEFESNENLDKIEFNHKVIALADKYDLHIKLPLKVNNYDEKTLDSITKYMEARVKVKNKKFTQTLQLDKSFKNQFKYRLAKNNIRFKANTPENGGWRIEEMINFVYLILKTEQESKSNRSKINWKVYNQLKDLDCDFMWNFAGDKVKPIWLADNPNSDKIKVLANRLQRGVK